ncbi:MAG: YhdT family protein [Synergistaceae bacterium]|nr:YhdT family protein [Synergistaceae bacterium]
MANSRLRKESNLETIVVLLLYIIFFAWWYITAYGFGDDPSKYKFVFGFPEWFFYSCLVGYPAISFLLWIAVRLFFRDTPLEDNDHD